MVSNDLQGRDITDPDVLRVMSEIQRERFVPEAYQSQAYADGPLPIGMGQTISQPYIVALMTQELKVNCDCEVLEVGTGSGYQATVLSKLVKKVYTIERFSELSESARVVLSECGATNVEFCVGDGSCGWPGSKVFDRIIITAAVPSIPEPLVKQLVEGGRMVAPVGSSWVQRLVVCEKKAGRIAERAICDVRFVRLLGEYGFEEP
jgi:protein-L-isoaspartate(D-aspartate) O-methyltransferase